jgi:XisI protein
MGSTAELTQKVKQVLMTQANEPISHGEITLALSFDDQHARYLLLAVGWNGVRRVHAVFCHLAIVDDQVWIEHDATPPPGIAEALIEAGIARDQIVLAFHHPNLRPQTAFAT